jgi:GxxExxY protein
VDNKHADLTRRVIGAFYQVYNTLGYGFSEKIYENALALEPRKLGLRVESQRAITVYYDHELIGQFFSDIVVNETIILELKAVHELLAEHEAQLLNYLKATLIEVGLLLNFGPTPEVKRKVYDNQRKGSLSWIREQNTDSQPLK